MREKGEVRGDWGSSHMRPCSTCLSLKRHMENAVNEVILVLTWFKIITCVVEGWVPILRS